MSKVPAGHPELVTLEQFEALPWCRTCGPCPGLKSYGEWEPAGAPQRRSEGTLLFCSGCGTDVVWWSH